MPSGFIASSEAQASALQSDLADVRAVIDKALKRKVQTKKIPGMPRIFSS